MIKTIRRTLVEHILKSTKDEFLHKELKAKVIEICSKVPNKRKSIEVSDDEYYSLISKSKKDLLYKHRKVLSSVRGLGYKLADDVEKIEESTTCLQREFNINKKNKDILSAVNVENLPKEVQSQYHQLNSCTQLTSKLITQLIDNLLTTNSLPSSSLIRLEQLTKGKLKKEKL